MRWNYGNAGSARLDENGPQKNFLVHHTAACICPAQTISIKLTRGMEQTGNKKFLGDSGNISRLLAQVSPSLLGDVDRNTVQNG